MPEIPEMQALAERLDVAVGGRVLTGVQPLQFAALKTFAPDPASLLGACRSKASGGGPSTWCSTSATPVCSSI